MEDPIRRPMPEFPGATGERIESSLEVSPDVVSALEAKVGKELPDGLRVSKEGDRFVLSESSEDGAISQPLLSVSRSGKLSITAVARLHALSGGNVVDSIEAWLRNL